MKNRYSYTKYLEAKRTVDARAINSSVWNKFVYRLNSLRDNETIQILEIGAGTGATLFNVLSVLEQCDVSYSIVEIEGEHVAKLKAKLLSWVEFNNGVASKKDDCAYIITVPGRKITVNFAVSDVYKYLEKSDKDVIYDAIIGQAVLDLLDVKRLLLILRKVLRRGGLFYFPINFDGMTTFLPEYDRDTDELVEQIYHRSMKDGKVDRSQTGRQVLMHLYDMGMHIIEAASSDWVVLPGRNRKYVGEEGYFLKYILQFVNRELLKSGLIENQILEKWYTTRLRQVEEGKLMYIAHQLDVLAANE